MILFIYEKDSYDSFLVPDRMYGQDACPEQTIILKDRHFPYSEKAALFLRRNKEGWHLTGLCGCSICTEEKNGPEEGPEARRRDADRPNADRTDAGRIVDDNLAPGDLLLKGGEMYRIITDSREEMLLSVWPEERLLRSYRFYSIKDISLVTIGKSPSGTIVYDHQGYVSLQHACLQREGKSWKIQSCKEGLYRNGVCVTGQVQLEYGDVLHLFGLQAVFLEGLLGINAAAAGAQTSLRPFCDKTDAQASMGKTENPYHPPESSKAPAREEELITGTLRLEAPPQQAGRERTSFLMQGGPALTMMLPMLAASLLYSQGGGPGNGSVLLGSLVLTSGTSVLMFFWILAGRLEERRKERRKERDRRQRYHRYLLRKEKDLEEMRLHNQKALALRFPPAAVCVNVGSRRGFLRIRDTGRKEPLWCRFGTGEIPFQVEVQIPEETMTLSEDDLWQDTRRLQERYRTLHDSPWLADLRMFRLIGMAGGRNRAGARNVSMLICVQMAVSYSPQDLKMVFFFDRERSGRDRRWEFAKWLPHAWAPGMTERYTAGDREEAEELCSILEALFSMGKEQEEDTSEAPYYLVFVEDALLLENTLLRQALLKTKRYVNVTTLLLSETVSELPETCDLILEDLGDGQMRCDRSSSRLPCREFRMDVLPAGEPGRFARRISGETRGMTGRGSGLPAGITFLELYRVQEPKELHAAGNWRKNRAGEHIRARIGVNESGAAEILDLHEKYHGPHGLIAGMTGSGKSELLQTLILSLAVGYSPREVCFLLIDYKGGGMSGLFDGLPHLAGQISNLSGSMVQRALLSIRSECRRRQRLLKEAGCNHIDQYSASAASGKEAMPHVFIIVDEFAELKQEVPEFLGGLISTARIGRSLGIHLILATQKPGGTIDENIRSNTRFTLCLRVQDRLDSMEVLGKPDAAYFRQPGRCCLQVGAGELSEVIQTGWSSAPFGKRRERSGPALLLGSLGRPCKLHRRRSFGQEMGTELKAIKDYLSGIAAETGYPRPRPLWLPPLPEFLALTGPEFREPGKAGQGSKAEHGGIRVNTGLVDLPLLQRRQALTLRFPEGGHHAVIGSVSSGKSTFLQTMLFGLLSEYDSGQLSVLILDYGSRMLGVFRDQPQVAGYADDPEGEDTGRLLLELERMAEERRRLLSGGSYVSFSRRKGREGLPLALIVIDGLMRFPEEENAEDLLFRLLREGENLGMLIAASAGPSGPDGIPCRMEEYFRTVITLGLADPFTCAEALRVPRVELMPDQRIKGRGLVKWEETTAEFQCALAVPYQQEYEREQAIREALEGRACS